MIHPELLPSAPSRRERIRSGAIGVVDSAGPEESREFASCQRTGVGLSLGRGGECRNEEDGLGGRDV